MIVYSAVNCKTAIVSGLRPLTIAALHFTLQAVTLRVSTLQICNQNSNLIDKFVYSDTCWMEIQHCTTR